ncbi:Uncharacterised protein [Lysinibacillus capsici]|uniref:Uncharacterized protein n=1 Tax=Lysinibacillus capsici TaxID=2115968 RepID=A0A2X1AI47_9BACI|nr:hypothetical protein [Lysinibacillus capsici]SPU37904.1 Uncharacterised protein [Lysinibacillus capsici]
MEKEEAYKSIIELQKEHIKLLIKISQLYGPDEDLLLEAFTDRIKEITDEIEEIEKSILQDE